MIREGSLGCFLVTGPRVGEMGGSPSLSTGRPPERMREPQRSSHPSQLLWPQDTIMPTCVCTQKEVALGSVRPLTCGQLRPSVASIAANGKVVRPKDELPSLPASSLQLVSDKRQWGVALTSKRAAAGTNES